LQTANGDVLPEGNLSSSQEHSYRLLPMRSSSANGYMTNVGVQFELARDACNNKLVLN
jgi:hypothetical protein